MYTSRRIDDKEIQLKRQNKIFFQISGAGPRGGAGGGGPGPAARAGLVLRLLPRPRPDAPARHDAPGDVPGRGGGEGRSQLRRPPDAVALGPSPAERGDPVLPHRHPVPAGGGLRGGGAASLGGRPDDVVYCSTGEGTTSEGEFWESLNTACNRKAPGPLPRRGQRLRDLRPRGGPDRGGQHLQAAALVPRPPGPGGGRLRPAGQPGRRCGRRRPGAAPAAAPPSSTRR